MRRSILDNFIVHDRVKSGGHFDGSRHTPEAP